MAVMVKLSTRMTPPLSPAVVGSARLLQIVGELGGLPSRKPWARGFWARVQGEINQRFGYDYQNLWGPLMAYRNAMSKVEELL